MQSDALVTSTNWNHLVGYDENDAWGDNHDLSKQNRRIDTCVLCGDMHATNKKYMDVEFMHDAINGQKNIFKGTYMQTLYTNIYNLIKFHSTTMDRCDVCVCINCYYWTTRHNQNNLVPTMYLKWYMNTLHNGSCKCFDKRVLWRICKTLIQTHRGCSNYYTTLFSPSEIETIKKVGTSSLEETFHIIQQYYTEQSADSLFHDHKVSAKSARGNLRN